MGFSDWLETRRQRKHEHAARAAAVAAERSRARILAEASPRAAPINTVRLSVAGRVPVVGESHYQPALRLAARGASVESFDDGVRTWCALIPEPSNKHDRWAVRVDCLTDEGAMTVGYLARELAREYQPVLMSKSLSGTVGICPGMIMGGGAKFYGIWLSLADPPSLLMSSQPPNGHEVAAGDHQVAVTGEQHYADTLTALHGGGSGSVRHYATLRPVTIERGTHAGRSTLEVVVNGQVCGQLTYAMGERYASLFAGPVPICCEAAIKPGDKRHEVTLRLPKMA